LRGVLDIKRNVLTQKRLKEVLKYDPETGEFTWIDVTNWSIKIGSIAGSRSHSGYRDVRIDGVKYRAHRVAFLYMDGYLPENRVDHVNRLKDDNRFDNLREVSVQCNSRNCKVMYTNTSGVTGVNWDKERRKWSAEIRVHPKNIKLGRFISFSGAVMARWLAEVKYDFPNCNSKSSAYLYLKDNCLLSVRGGELYE